MKLTTARKIIAPFVKLGQVRIEYISHQRAPRPDQLQNIAFVQMLLFAGDTTGICLDDGFLILSGEMRCREFLKERTEKGA